MNRRPDKFPALTFEQRVEWFIKNPPYWGSSGTCYLAGLNGNARCPYGARGSNNHAAFAAGRRVYLSAKNTTQGEPK